MDLPRRTLLFFGMRLSLQYESLSPISHWQSMSWQSLQLRQLNKETAVVHDISGFLQKSISYNDYCLHSQSRRNYFSLDFRYLNLPPLKQTPASRRLTPTGLVEVTVLLDANDSSVSLPPVRNSQQSRCQQCVYSYCRWHLVENRPL